MRWKRILDYGQHIASESGLDGVCTLTIAVKRIEYEW